MKRDFNPASTISTTPADVLRNLAGRTTLQPGAPTGENDYRPAAATGTSANIPQDYYSANAFRRPTNGFGDVGTPRTDTDFRGAVADVFTEDIENAVRSNLPEPYRRDSPRVTRYVRQLTLVAAAAFQKQVRGADTSFFPRLSSRCGVKNPPPKKLQSLEIGLFFFFFF